MATATAWFNCCPVPVKRPSLMASIERYWRMRKCFICDAFGWCMHREYDVAVAEVEANERRQGMRAA